MEGFLSLLSGMEMFGRGLGIGTLMLRIGAAVFIGAMIGIDREIKNRPAGMRTHVLVCVGAALVSLIEQQTVAAVLSLGSGAPINVSVGRITSTVVSGVGFLGAGTIFMSEHKISGLTTAASLWCTACIGLAVGSGFIIMAFMAGVIVLVILRMMQKIIHVHTLKKLEVQFVHRQETLSFLSEYFSQKGCGILDVD
ncbi:MAG: MgtC/SapB family protein, partial [Clostridiales bacterium]|nr:MgtC/SapB family protein [Clostridiales bacterium]